MNKQEGKILTRGDVLQKGVQHGTVYETGHPQWVVRESKIRDDDNLLYSGEDAAWARVHEGRAHPDRFRLTATEYQALKDHVMVPSGTRQVFYDNTPFLQSYYPRRTTDLERYLLDISDDGNFVPRFKDPAVPLAVIDTILEQLAPAVDALVKVRIYHGDILLINTLIDEVSGDLSLIDFGRSAIYTGIVTSGEGEYFKEMRAAFLFSIKSIVVNNRLGDSFPQLERNVSALHQKHWENSYQSNNTTCQEYAQALRPLIASARK